MLGIIQKILLLICLFACAWIDYRQKKVYLWMLILFGGVGVVLQFLLRNISIAELAGGVCIGIACLFLSWLTKENIGFGDGAILMMTGVYLGFSENMMLFMTSLTLVGVTALILVVLKKKKGGDRMPWIPFIFVAYVSLLV